MYFILSDVRSIVWDTTNIKPPTLEQDPTTIHLLRTALVDLPYHQVISKLLLVDFTFLPLNLVVSKILPLLSFPETLALCKLVKFQYIVCRVIKNHQYSHTHQSSLFIQL